MYKKNDDVRQDKIVLQIISVIDQLLKDINKDCKFTAYKTLALSEKDGMLEFVPDSMEIANIIKVHGKIINFLREYNQKDEDFD